MYDSPTSFKIIHVVFERYFTGSSVPYSYYYYTSEELFLYKITVDKRTIHHFSRQNELLTGT